MHGDSQKPGVVAGQISINRKMESFLELQKKFSFATTEYLNSSSYV